MRWPSPFARPSRPAAGAIVILAFAAASLAACGSGDSETTGATNAQTDRPPKKRRVAAGAGKVTWVEGGKVEPGNLAYRCKNVTAVAMDAKYVYFTNSAGIGRVLREGNDVSTCEEVASGTGYTDVAASGGKVTYVRNGKVEPGNLAYRCKNVTDLAMDSQYAYFTNSKGIGRVPLDGNGAYFCDDIAAGTGITSVAASGGKVTYVRNGKVEPGNLAYRCKNVQQVAMDSQYAYFTNSEGIGRALRDGNDVSTCDEVRWARAAGGPYGPFTSVAAGP